MKPNQHDEHHGQGGTYEVHDGKRVRTDKPQAQPRGGGARDKDGEPLDKPVDRIDRLPEPVKPAWLTEVEAAQAAKAGEPKAGEPAKKGA